MQMITKTNAVLVILAMLTYFVALNTARAFYDPGTQRWLNRDPLGEIGFESLRKHKGFHNGRFFIRVGLSVNGADPYLYLKDNPMNYIDPLGLLEIMPDTDMDSCMANCDAAYKCAPGLGQALADHGLGSILSGIGTGASCAIAGAFEGVNPIADLACLGFLGVDVVEAAAIIQEASRLAQEAKGALASCLGRCAVKYNDWDAARDDWYDHFPTARPH